MGDPETDLVLWYDEPAAGWMQALPVGNGTLGAMVFGGVEHERLALNIDTLWSGGPHAAGVEDGPATLARVRALLDAGDRVGAGEESTNCLLYTSDAADDLLCVDLGGRRIIK